MPDPVQAELDESLNHLKAFRDLPVVLCYSPSRLWCLILLMMVIPQG